MHNKTWQHTDFKSRARGFNLTEGGGSLFKEGFLVHNKTWQNTDFKSARGKGGSMDGYLILTLLL